MALQAQERRLANSPHSEPSPNANGSQFKNDDKSVMPKGENAVLDWGSEGMAQPWQGLLRRAGSPPEHPQRGPVTTRAASWAKLAIGHSSLAASDDELAHNSSRK